MAFEDFRVALALLLDEIAKEPDNKHELQETLREKLTEMQAMGLPLPDDLVAQRPVQPRDSARPSAEVMPRSCFACASAIRRPRSSPPRFSPESVTRMPCSCGARKGKPARKTRTPETFRNCERPGAPPP